MSHSTYVDDPSWLYGRMDIMSVRLSRLLVKTPTIGVEHVSPPAWCGTKTSWPPSTKAPLLAGRKFSVVRRRRSHCVCVCVCPLLFPENRRHCQCTMLRQGDSTVRVDALQRLLSHGQVLNWEVLLLSVQAWHCPWTAWSQDHIICNCTYKKKSSKSVGSCWSLRWTLYPALCPVWAETSHQTFSWFQDFTDASLHQHNVSTTAPVNYLFRGGKKHPVVNPQHGGEKGKDASQPVTASC